MKIAFLEFPLNMPGGITTFRNNMKRALEEKGHEIKQFHITLNTTRKPKLEGFDGILGFKKDEWLEEYYETVKDFDYLFFIKACPHLLKRYKDEDWKKCYDIDVPKAAWIHDNYFEKYYPWFAEIPEKYNVKMVFPSDYHFNSCKGMKADKAICPNIIYYDDNGLFTEIKEDLIVDPSEFKSIKFKHLLAKNPEKINAKINVYGHTDTLYFSNYKDIFKTRDNYEVKGWQPISEVYSDLKKAKIMIDLARRGNTDTIWDTVINEAVGYGCLLVTQTPICPTFDFKYIKINPKYIDLELNEILLDFESYNKDRLYNLNLLNEKFNVSVLTDELLKFLEAPYKSRTSQLF